MTKNTNKNSKPKNSSNADKRHILIDKIIKQAFKILGAPPGLALIATGGYGRQDMSGQSDTDLLAVTDQPISARGRAFLDRLIKELWAQGIKPSLLLRDLDEAAASMENDLHFLTSLLDLRHVAGDRDVTRALTSRLLDYKASHPPGDFVSAKLTERDQRHARMGDTRYWLEPNVKDGKGGLRDLHTLLWIAGYLYGVGTAEGIKQKGLLTATEAQSLQAAYDFFSRVRRHLHEHTGRAEERLSFDVQPDIALLMGYTDPAPTRRAEMFMKDYFLMAGETGHLTRAVCAELETKALAGGATAATRKMAAEGIIDGFPLLNNRLSFAKAAPLSATPTDLLRIFYVSQTRGYDIHPQALRQLRAALKKTPQLIENNPDASAIFLSILTHKKEAEATLRRMNEAEIITALIPAFKNIRAHMQFDMYHVFTADEHTIRACGMMHRIENGELAQAAPLATSLFQKVTAARRALYAAMFLHDIAKGTGDDHSRAGADITKAAAPLLGLDASETETAVWLVENHLLMTMTAFKRDLGDPQTIAQFAAAVQSAERLALLLILTVADIMAVGPDRWNNWKAGLLRTLYHQTYSYLSGDGGVQDTTQLRDLRLEETTPLLDGQNSALDALGYLISTAPPQLWQTLDAPDIARLCRAIEKRRRLDDTAKAPQPLITVQPVMEKDHTDIIIHTPDRSGLFATLAGAIAAAGASIVDARIFTLNDSMALDIFRIQTLRGKAYDNTAHIKKTIQQSLAGQFDLAADMRERLHRRATRQKLFARPARVSIDNTASRTATLIEIGAHDRPGILYEITSALTAEQVQITAAKITTFGNRVADTFYVKDSFGLKILHPKKLLSVEKAILNALEQTP